MDPCRGESELWLRDAVMLKQRDLERISLCNMLSHTNDKAVLIPLQKKRRKKKLFIVRIPSFLNFYPIGHSALQRTINELVHPVSIYAMLITIYLSAIYKCFRWHFHHFFWETVPQFGVLKNYLLSGSDRQIFSYI